MIMSDLYAIYGASGCGRGVMPLARQQCRALNVPVDRLVFIDDGEGATEVNGHRVMTFAQFVAEPASRRFANIAIADGRIRERLALKCSAHGVNPWTVRAEASQVYDSVLVGEGAIICAYVTLTSNIRIGRHFHANLYSYVEHDCVIGDFVTFAPGVQCNGNVAIGDRAYIGAGAVIRQGRPGQPLRIGEGAVVGMGAVVTKDVPPGVTVVGNPARLMEKGGVRG